MAMSSAVASMAAMQRALRVDMKSATSKATWQATGIGDLDPISRARKKSPKVSCAPAAARLEGSLCLRLVDAAGMRGLRRSALQLQHHARIALRGHLVAARPDRPGPRPGIAGCGARSALDIGIDAGRPGVRSGVYEQAIGELVDMAATIRPRPPVSPRTAYSRSRTARIRPVTQSTFCSMQRGILQRVEALCGPTRVSMFGKPADCRPR